MRESEYLRLLNLLSDDPSQQFPWRPEELRALWLHLLNTSILISLASSDPILALRAAQLCKSANNASPIESLADLLRVENPDPELLEIVAAGAQLQLEIADAVIPKPVAQATLDLMLLHRRAQFDVAIPQIADESLRKSAEALASLAWLDPGTQQSIARCRAKLR